MNVCFVIESKLILELNSCYFCVVLTTSLYILLETQVLTTSLYDRTLLCIGDGNETVSHTQAEPQNTDDQGTQYGEDAVFDVYEPTKENKKPKRSMMGSKLSNIDRSQQIKQLVRRESNLSMFELKNL